MKFWLFICMSFSLIMISPMSIAQEDQPARERQVKVKKSKKMRDHKRQGPRCEMIDGQKVCEGRKVRPRGDKQRKEKLKASEPLST